MFLKKCLQSIPYLHHTVIVHTPLELQTTIRADFGAHSGDVGLEGCL